jgi:hypothetical protein
VKFWAPERKRVQGSRKAGQDRDGNGLGKNRDEGRERKGS